MQTNYSILIYGLEDVKYKIILIVERMFDLNDSNLFTQWKRGHTMG